MGKVITVNKRETIALLETVFSAHFMPVDGVPSSAIPAIAYRKICRDPRYARPVANPCAGDPAWVSARLAEGTAVYRIEMGPFGALLALRPIVEALDDLSAAACTADLNRGRERDARDSDRLWRLLANAEVLQPDDLIRRADRETPYRRRWRIKPLSADEMTAPIADPGSVQFEQAVWRRCPTLLHVQELGTRLRNCLWDIGTDRRRSRRYQSGRSSVWGLWDEADPIAVAEVDDTGRLIESGTCRDELQPEVYHDALEALLRALRPEAVSS